MARSYPVCQTAGACVDRVQEPKMEYGRVVWLLDGRETGNGNSNYFIS